MKQEVFKDLVLLGVTALLAILLLAILMTPVRGQVDASGGLWAIGSVVTFTLVFFFEKMCFDD